MNQRGFIGILVLIIIALALLNYFFDWSIFDAAASEKGRGTIDYIVDVVSTSWYFVRDHAVFVWDKLLKLLTIRETI